MQFFNPKMSAISFGISILRGTIQINMAKSLNPNMQGRPAKGQKVYDWDNSNYYSITPLECVDLINAYPLLMNGTYQNPKENDARFKTSFGITHFRDNQPSRLLLYQAKNQQSGQPLGTLMLTLVPPQGAQSTTYLFRQNELIMFRNYIECGVRYLDFAKDLLDGLKRSEKAAQNNNNNVNNYANPAGGGMDNGYQNTGTFDNLNNTPPAAGNPPAGNPPPNSGIPTETVNSVDNMNFDWGT